MLTDEFEEMREAATTRGGWVALDPCGYGRRAVGV